jgi:hypothetical protein
MEKGLVSMMIRYLLIFVILRTIMCSIYICTYSQKLENEKDLRMIEDRCTYVVSAPNGWQWDEVSYSEIVPRPIFHKINSAVNDFKLRICILVNENIAKTKMSLINIFKSKKSFPNELILLF